MATDVKPRPAGIFCQACYRGWPELVAVVVAQYGVVHACRDPYLCRLAATRAGIYAITTVLTWTKPAPGDGSPGELAPGEDDVTAEPRLQ